MENVTKMIIDMTEDELQFYKKLIKFLKLFGLGEEQLERLAEIIDNYSKLIEVVNLHSEDLKNLSEAQEKLIHGEFKESEDNNELRQYYAYLNTPREEININGNKNNDTL